MRVFIDGALSLSECLGVEEFVVCPMGKTLVGSVSMIAKNGWRYVKLKDGRICIQSQALSHIWIGNSKCESTKIWIREILQPRLQISFDCDGNVIARVKNMQAKCGDIEKNPGPEGEIDITPGNITVKPPFQNPPQKAQGRSIEEALDDLFSVTAIKKETSSPKSHKKQNKSRKNSQVLKQEQERKLSKSKAKQPSSDSESAGSQSEEDLRCSCTAEQCPTNPCPNSSDSKSSSTKSEASTPNQENSSKESSEKNTSPKDSTQKPKQETKSGNEEKDPELQEDSDSTRKTKEDTQVHRRGWLQRSLVTVSALTSSNLCCQAVLGVYYNIAGVWISPNPPEATSVPRAMLSLVKDYVPLMKPLLNLTVKVPQTAWVEEMVKISQKGPVARWFLEKTQPEKYSQFLFYMKLKKGWIANGVAAVLTAAIAWKVYSYTIPPKAAAAKVDPQELEDLTSHLRQHSLMTSRTSDSMLMLKTRAQAWMKENSKQVPTAQYHTIVTAIKEASIPTEEEMDLINTMQENNNLLWQVFHWVRGKNKWMPWSTPY